MVIDTQIEFTHSTIRFAGRVDDVEIPHFSDVSGLGHEVTFAEWAGANAALEDASCRGALVIAVTADAENLDAFEFANLGGGWDPTSASGFPIVGDWDGDGTDDIGFLMYVDSTGDGMAAPLDALLV